MRQAHVVGSLAVEVPDDIDFARLDAAIGASIGGAIYEPPAFQPDRAKALASRAAIWMAALQRSYRIPVNRQYGTLAPTPRPDGGVTVPLFMDFYSHDAFKIALQFVPTAINTMLQSLSPPGANPEDVAVQSEEVAEALRSHEHVGLDNFYMLCAADEMDIPVRRYVGSIYGRGTGRHLKWFNHTATEKTRLVGSQAARSKRFTHVYLERFGLPVAQGGIAHSEGEAVRMAAQIGYPVVVKAEDLDNGRGVAAGILTEAILRKSWQDARKMSNCVLVQKHHFGLDHRLTVIDGEVVAVMRRKVWGVTGNGIDTIEDLVAESLSDDAPRGISRRRGELAKTIDEEALGILEESGLTLQTVLPEGQHVPLRRRANISTGGSQEAVPHSEVHPENVALAIRAAKLMRLDIAGIDLIIEDIDRPWREQNAIICEVNSIPQVGGRLFPDFHRNLIAHTIGDDPRIPVHALVTRPGTLPPEDVLLDMARQLGCNAASTSRAIYVNGKPIAAKLASTFDAAVAVIDDTDTEAALVVLDYDQLLRRGLPCDQFESLRFQELDQGQVWDDFDKSVFLALVGPHCRNVALPAGYQAE